MESKNRRPSDTPQTENVSLKGDSHLDTSSDAVPNKKVSNLILKNAKRRTLSAGVIPVFLGDRGPIYLLLRAFSYWDFPKGGARTNEEPMTAAVREMREETTIEEVDFPWGFGFQETLPYSRGKVARYYIGRVHTMSVALLPNPENGQVEHHEYRWVPYDQAVKLVSDRVLPILNWAHDTINMG